MPKKLSARLLLLPLLVLVVAAVGWRLACPPTHPPPSSIDAVLQRIAPLGLHVTPDPVHRGVWLSKEPRTPEELDRLQAYYASEWSGVVWLGPRGQPDTGYDQQTNKTRAGIGGLELYGDPDVVKEIVETLGR